MGTTSIQSPVIARATREAGLTLHEIMGIMELMRVSFSKGELEIALDRLARLTSEAAHLSSIVSTILALKEFEDAPAGRTRRRFDMIALLHDIVRKARPLVGNKPVTVIDVPSPKPLMIFFDPLIIQHIVTGLVLHAVTLTDRGRIALILNTDGKTVTITVTDTGRGMEREQISAVLTPSGAGGDDEIPDISGLGLRVVRHLVGLLDGVMNISSKMGEGTIVDVVLPLGEPEGLPAPGRGKQQPQALVCGGTR